MNTTSPILSASNLTKSFGSVEVLKGVNLEVFPSEVISIVGASGAGKTTLLQILGTLERADSGYIQWGNIEVNRLNDNELSRFRNTHIGFVFQFHHLLPEFTALENVCIPGFIAKRNESEVIKKAKELLDYLDISHRLDHKPKALSGGEQQRVAVARALINSPGLVLADEPTGNLDSGHAQELHKLFLKLRDETGQSTVIVTHNEHLASNANRILTMSDGVIVNNHE